MDRRQFDGLARLVSANLPQSRRRALAALVGAVVLGRAPAASLAKGRGKVKAQAKTCYPGTQCSPGRGKNNSGCDFSNSTTFIEQDVRGSNLSNANFTDTDAWGADFRGANLSGACFVNATLLDAKLGNSVNLDKAIFCHTIMPDGSIDDSGCDKATACCPTAPPPQGDTCRGLFNLCGPLSFGECCEGLTCERTIAQVVTACEKVCQTDADCRPFSTHLKCDFDPLICPVSVGKCCTPK